MTEAGAGCEKECLLAAVLWCLTGARSSWSLSLSGVISLPPATVTSDRSRIGQDCRNILLTVRVRFVFTPVGYVYFYLGVVQGDEPEGDPGPDEERGKVPGQDV